MSNLDEISDDDLSPQFLAQKHNCKPGEVWDKTLKRCVPKGVPTKPVPEPPTPSPGSTGTDSSAISKTITSADGKTVLTLTGALSISSSGSTPTPQPPGPVPTPQPPTTGNIGPDGVKQLYPTKGKEFYLTDNPDKSKFNVSFGTGSHLPYTQKTEGGLTFFNTKSVPVNYGSGGNGLTTRLDIYASGGIWNNKTKYDYANNPGYLFLPPPECIKNGETTAYIRPHGTLGPSKHHSLAFKTNGRDEDAIRSLIETCAADESHSTPYAHWNYTHLAYEPVKGLKVFGTPAKNTDGKWLGLKVVKKGFTIEMWQDSNPFDASGKPLNNWKKIVEWTDTGSPKYGKKCDWYNQKNVIRIDGFNNIDFCKISDRDIDPTATPTIMAEEKFNIVDTPEGLGYDGIEPKADTANQVDVMVTDANGNTGRLQGTLTLTSGATPVPPGPNPTPTPVPPQPPTPTGNLNKEGVQVLATRTSFSWEISSDPNNDSQLKLESLSPSSPKTEGAVKFHSAQCKVIHYASGQADSKTIRFDMFPPGAKGQAQKHTWKDNPQFLWDPSVPLDFCVIGFYRPHASTGAHTSTSIKIRGGIHTGSHDPRASDLEMDLPTIGGQAKYARELDHPDYDYEPVDKQYDKTLGIEENVWYGLQLISYINPDGKSTTNQLYVLRDPFNQDGSIKNENWKLFSQTVDIDGKSTGKYTKAPLWSAFVTTLRIDGWDTVDFCKLAWYGIEKTVTPPIPTPTPTLSVLDRSFDVSQTGGTITLFSNLTDTATEYISFEIVKQPSNGKVTQAPIPVSANKIAYTYIPNQGFTGTDSFQYQATMGTQKSNIGTVSVTVVSIPPPNPPPTSEGIIHAMMVDPSGNEQCDQNMIQTCKDLTPNKPIGVVYFTDHWKSNVGPFPQKMCDDAKAKGCIPFIRMNAYELKSTTVTCASILSGKHDSELQAYAQAAKAWGGTILFEMGTEVNGNFLGFSGEGSAKYKQMIQKVMPIFKQTAPNMIAFFHGDYNDLSSHPEQWYPGDQYFDWIGTSMYGQSNGKGCIGSLGSGSPSPYDVMSTTGNKPLAILEWGISDITDTTNTLKNIPTRFPKIKLMSYWNEKGSFNRLIQKTPQHLKAYQDGISNDNYTSTYYNP